MLELSNSSHLLEQKSYKYQLQDVAEPQLYRDAFSYEEAPKIPFNHRRVPMNMPEEIWITDTTFRDGQQSMEPFSVQQIVDLYKLMSRLSGPKGIIRQTEFFIFSKMDREALELLTAAPLETDPLYFHKLAIAYERLGRPEEAMAALERGYALLDGPGGPPPEDTEEWTVRFSSMNRS